MHKRILAVGLLAVGTLPAHPADAQALSLQSGDSLTVGAVGTSGTYQGQPLVNTTSAYTSAAVGTSSNTGTVVAPAGSTFALNAGGSLTAAGDGAAGLYAPGSSVTVSGGTIRGTGSGSPGLQTASGAHVTVTGGSLIAGSGPALFIVGSTATITGGSFSANDAAQVWQDSLVTITGGTFTSGEGPAIYAGLTAFDPSTVTITGGTFTATGSEGCDVEADQGSTIRVSGGVYSDTAFSPNPMFQADYKGVIDLFGSFRDGNGNPLTGAITNGSGTIHGTLLSGQSFNATYQALSGTIEFNVGPAPAPEPSQSAALALGAFGLVVLGLKARKRSTLA